MHGRLSKVDALMAPLPERRILNRCVDPTMVDPMTGFAQVIRLSRSKSAARWRSPDTDIGLLVRTGVEVTFPIYTFGKIAHGQEAARAGIDVGRSGVDYARSELEFLVKKAYGAQMADSAHGVLKDGRKRMAKAKKSIEKELAADTGRFTSNDLRKLLVDEAELESRFLETEALSAEAWTGIRLAADVNDSTNVRLDTMKLVPVFTEVRTLAEYLELAYDARRTYEWRALQSELDRAK